MSASANEILEYCSSLSTEQLEDYAWRNYRILEDYFHDSLNYSYTELVDIFLEHFVLFCAMDASLSEEEWGIIRACLGLTEYDRDSVEKKVRRLRLERSVTKTKRFCYDLPRDEREAFVCVAMSFLVADGRFNNAEYLLLGELLTTM